MDRSSMIVCTVTIFSTAGDVITTASVKVTHQYRNNFASVVYTTGAVWSAGGQLKYDVLIFLVAEHTEQYRMAQ